MTDDQILHIWKEIANGRGRHGSFLMKFGEAVSAADPMNFEIVKISAIGLIGKYGLDRYLNNFPSTDGPDPEKRVKP